MRKKRRNFGGAFILLLLFAIAVTVTLTIPVFNITSVTVMGNAHLRTEEILAAAEIPVGMNIYRISMRKAEERVSALPYAKEVSIRRHFPARVTVEVSERCERGAVECGGGYAIVDDTCRVLRLSLDADTLPCVTGSEVESARIGENIEMKEPRFCTDFQTLMRALDTAELGVEWSKFSLDSVADIWIETKPGLEIHLGAIEDVEYKLQLCKNILEGDFPGVTKESSGVLRWTNAGQFSYRQNKN